MDIHDPPACQADTELIDHACSENNKCPLVLRQLELDIARLEPRVDATIASSLRFSMIPMRNAKSRGYFVTTVKYAGRSGLVSLRISTTACRSASDRERYRGSRASPASTCHIRL